MTNYKEYFDCFIENNLIEDNGYGKYETVQVYPSSISNTKAKALFRDAAGILIRKKQGDLGLNTKQITTILDKIELSFPVVIKRETTGDMLKAGSPELEFILGSQRICNINAENEWVFFNEKANTRQRFISNTAFNMEIGKLPEEQRGAWLAKHQKSACFVFRPDQRDKKLMCEDDVTLYNIYEFPACFRTANSKTTYKCPEIVFKHIHRMVGENAEATQYVLDWAAASVRGKNRQWLCLIGEGGSGKGLFTDLMKNVHNGYSRASNTNNVYGYSINGDNFEKEFNGDLENKTLIVVDEGKIRNEKAIERTKVLADQMMVVESKGINKKNAENHLNILLNSNKDNALLLEHKQRRHSIVDCLGANISTIIDDDKMQAYCDAVRESYVEFGLYLHYSHQIKNNMNIVWLSEGGKKMQKNSVPDFMEDLMEYCERNPGGEWDFLDITGRLRITAGRSACESAIKTYGLSDRIQITKKGRNESSRIVRSLFKKSDLSDVASDTPVPRNAPVPNTVPSPTLGTASREIEVEDFEDAPTLENIYINENGDEDFDINAEVDIW